MACCAVLEAQFRIIVERVVERKIPLVLLTDCYWAQELTPHVLMVEASAVSSLFSLIVADVSKESGDVMDRLSEINGLRRDMVGYLRATPGRPPESAISRTR